jgi:hypothetical protein
MGYRALVTAILIVHFGFLAYLVLGGLPAIRWPKAFWPHLAAVLWGLAAITLPVVCPLTWAEDWARQRAGEPPLTAGFIDRYIENVLFPERYSWLVRILVALVVLGSWALAFRAWSIRRTYTGAKRRTWPSGDS